MQNRLKRILKNYLLKRAGQLSYQALFEELYALSLKGMNIGGGTNPKISGEIQALEYIKTKLIQKGIERPILFDVGANVGHYSLLLDQIFNSNGFIYAFEPSEKTFSQLLENTKQLTNLKAQNMGLGDTKTALTLYSNEEGSGLASVYARQLAHFNIEMKPIEEIQIEVLDDFCQQAQITHIHLLKLDVEGHEIKVLEGAKNLLAQKKIDFIQFEFGGCNIDSKTYFRDFFYLLEKDYAIYRIVKDGLFPIKKYKEIYEVFTTTNYLAERKK